VQPIEPPQEQPPSAPEFRQQPPPAPAPEPASPPLPEQPPPLQQAPPPAPGTGISLNAATFEQLREHGLSVTQATRVLAYRERLGGYNSVDDLDDVPGFPGDFLEEFKRRASV
jgi:DNA uptake protein ComE-like DNA-binding protein